jgi:hypothetical protein
MPETLPQSDFLTVRNIAKMSAHAAVRGSMLSLRLVQYETRLARNTVGIASDIGGEAVKAAIQHTPYRAE